jgi:phage regulator Rha-like protein
MADITTIAQSQTMSSLQIAELTGKQHKDVLRAIRTMEKAWEKVNGRKFAPFTANTKHFKITEEK